MAQSDTNKVKLAEAINKLVSEFSKEYQYSDDTFCDVTIDLAYDFPNKKWSCLNVDLCYPVIPVTSTRTEEAN